LAGHLLADALRGLAAHLLVDCLLDVGALGVEGLLALGGVDGARRVDDLHAALLVGDLAALLLHHLLHLGATENCFKGTVSRDGYFFRRLPASIFRCQNCRCRVVEAGY
jgi:hypothetical protein